MTRHGIGSVRWHAHADLKTLQLATIALINACARLAIRKRGEFHLVLSGGNTPREIYRGLRSAQTDWSVWHIYFSDERCLSKHDPERNSRMAGECWLNHVPIPTHHIHVIRGELGPKQAALRYAKAIRHVGEFDLALLGLGEDGHTASLFPGHPWGIAADACDTLPVFAAPKPPAQRVSLSAARLSRSKKVVFVVSGQAKQGAVADWRAHKDIPARAIVPPSGVDVMIESSLLR